MAIEYAGFIPTQAINWADLTEDLAGKVYQVGEERQKKREELDKIAADNQAMLNAWQPGKNQTFNQAVLRGADQGRVLIKQWNNDLKAGLISPTDYKNKMNNMKEYWGILAQTAKTYDDRYLEIVKRQTPDENGKIQASSFEIDMFDDLAQMSDLSQSATQWDNDGRLYMANTDPNNGKIKGNIYDVRTVNLPDNIIANRVYVDESVNDIVKTWEPKTIFKDLGKGGELNIESVKQQDAYKIMVENVVNTVAPDNNPRAQISVLADNGVITPYYYKTDQEYKSKKQEELNKLKQLKIDAGVKDTEPTKLELDEIELSLVRKVQDRNGLFMPVLTDEQKKKAKERVRSSVGIQLAEKISGSPQQKWTSGDGTTAADKKEQQRVNEYQRGYVASLDAFGLDEQGKKTKQPDLSGLDNSYKYENKGGKVYVYKLDSKIGKDDPVSVISSPKGLAQYTVYGKSPAEQETNYELGRTQYRRSKGLDGAPKQDNIPSATRAEWKKSGWTDAQINEAVRLKKIKVI
jgi:hypothetical protein